MKPKTFERRIWRKTRDIFSDDNVDSTAILANYYNSPRTDYWPPVKLSVIGDYIRDE